METQSKNNTAQSPVLKEAIEITLRILEGRARLYRNLIIVVSVLFLSSILATIFSGLWILLTGLVLIVPFCGCFIALDSRKVSRWQIELLNMWQKQNLELDLFSKVITNFQKVPPQSLKTMLSGLPKTEVLHQVPPKDRTKWIHQIHHLGRRQERKIWLSTALVSLGFIGLATGATLQAPLLLLSAGILIVSTVALSKLRRARKAKDLN